jgi:hypothetical protein
MEEAGLVENVGEQVHYTALFMFVMFCLTLFNSLISAVAYKCITKPEFFDLQKQMIPAHIVAGWLFFSALNRISNSVNEGAEWCSGSLEGDNNVFGLED